MSIIKSFSQTSFFILLSRILGFVRELLFARIFGASMAADAFNLAYRLPNFFRNIFGEGAMQSSIIPTYHEIRSHQGEQSSWSFLIISFSYLNLILFGIWLLGLILMPNIIHMVTQNFSSEKLSLSISLARIVFAYVFFICLSAHIASVLNIFGHFAATAANQVLYNAWIIIVIVAILPHFNQSIHVLAYAVIIGGLCSSYIFGGWHIAMGKKYFSLGRAGILQ